MGIWQRYSHSAIENGSNECSVTLGLLGVYTRPGDGASWDGGRRWYEVESIDADNPNTKFKIVGTFEEDTIADGPLIIDNRSYRHQVPSDILETMRQLVAGQTDVITTTGQPSDSIGADNSLAFDAAAKVLYRKTGGTWDNGTSFAPEFAPDAIGLLSGRAAHDGEAGGYCYLSIDGDGDEFTTAVLFFKKSASSGDWSDASPLSGSPGSNGVDGWTPIFSVATDGARRVLHVTDWTGGTGTKPATDKYVGVAGLVDTIGDGIDIRGASGIDGTDGTNFEPDASGAFSGRSAYDGEEEGFCYLSIDGDGDALTVACLFFKNTSATADWSSPTPFQGPKGDPGTTDFNELTNKPTLGTAAAQDVGYFATAAQGALADSAVQPGDLAGVATSGAYGDLSGTPSLAAVATSGSYNDLTDKPTSIGRELLTGARTYYVRTDGSDSNDGLANTSGGAFLTIQKAMDVVFGTLDIGGQTVTIQVANGTYAGDVTGAAPQVGAGTVQIVGDTSTLTNVVISGLVIIKNQCVCTFDGISFAPSTGTAVTASNAGIVYLYRVRFAGTATTHVRADVNGILNFMGDYTIAASAGRHVRATHNGIVQWNSGVAITVTLTGTPAFTNAFVWADGLGYVVIANVTFSGSATGKRYDLTGNSVVNTFGGSTSLFPGSTAGTTGSGGQYI